MHTPDFAGYATKNDLRCSDGRVIRKDAFAKNDGATVPLVWQHCHADPANVLGHAKLENRQDGVYAYCYFNGSEVANTAKELVAHGDINAMSIYANHLRQNGTDVQHGNIVEVSLVLSPANPGALIESVAVSHGDGYDVAEDEAIIYTGEMLSHSEGDNSMAEELVHEDAEAEETAEDDGPTVADVYETMNDDQKTVVAILVQEALDHAADDNDAEGEAEHADQEKSMHKNVFESEDETMTHADIQGFAEAVFDDARRHGSFRDAFLAHTQEYGIEDIDLLFPDAKALADEPTLIKRQTEWVSAFMSGTTHRPFARIKSLQADITGEEARARGYITGAKKVSEVIRLLKRVTTPTTVYKKQVLDRDDILDVADFNVVDWLRREMRIMLDEEIARAALIGDGRADDSPDKINEENIRPIWTDDDLYSIKVRVPSDVSNIELIDAIFASLEDYRGSGRPTLFLAAPLYYSLLRERDTHGRRLYESEAALAAELGVAGIVKVELMKNLTRTVEIDGEEAEVSLQAILVNPADYVFGTDKGGEISSFEDFDIDYNQHKYLLEGRCSGALRDPRTAVIIEKLPAE